MKRAAILTALVLCSVWITTDSRTPPQRRTYLAFRVELTEKNIGFGDSPELRAAVGSNATRISASTQNWRSWTFAYWIQDSPAFVLWRLRSIPSVKRADAY